MDELDEALWAHFRLYNLESGHQSLGNRTPWSVYREGMASPGNRTKSGGVQGTQPVVRIGGSTSATTTKKPIVPSCGEAE